MGRRAAEHASPQARTATRCNRCGFFVARRALHDKKALLPPSYNQASTPKRTTASIDTRTRTAPPSPPPAGATSITPPTTTMKLPGRPMVVKCVYISWCACFGTLARLYTDDIQPSNLALQGSFLSNSLGSFALGALAASDLSEDNMPGLYTGLTVGLCGSYTTYSGWNLRIARRALRDAPGPGGAIVTVVAIVKSLAFFAACFVAGRDLVIALASHGRRLQWRGRDTSSASTGRALGVMGSVFALLALLLIVDDNRGRRTDWLACVFAPFGALSRFFLSKHLNSRWRDGAFPVGTFVANVTGSLAMGLIYYGARRKDLAGWNGIALTAFQGGFLGSLTTMSTFMSEVVGHRERHSTAASYVYLAATAIVAQAVVLIVGAALGD